MQYNPGSGAVQREVPSAKPKAKKKDKGDKNPFMVIGTTPPRMGDKPSTVAEVGVPAPPSALALQAENSRGTIKSAGGNRLAEMTARLSQVAEENDILKRLKEEISELGTSLNDNTSVTMDRVTVVEQSVKDVRKSLEQETHTLRQMLKREPEVSFADFSALQSQVQTSVKDVLEATATVKIMKEEVIQSVQDDICELKDQVKKSGEPREMDTLFHSRVSALEGKLNDIKNEVHAAVADILDDVAKIQDLQEIEEELEMKASSADVRQLATQQQQLAQSIGSMAEWLAVRPETADGTKGTGSSLTRFKCLTCDREIKTQGQGNGGAQMRGSFLPKLDGVSGGSSLPGGPGLNAAEARKIVEDRLAG
eukprot:gene31624-6818_t